MKRAALYKMSKGLALINGNIVTPYRIIQKGTVLVKGQSIEAVGKVDGPFGGDVEIIDVNGLYIAPGFIDIHVHGGGGGDVMDGDPDFILAMAKEHNKHGATAMLPTTVAAPWNHMLAAVKAVEEAAAMPGTAAILGVHLEGPYISPMQKGALDERYVKEPDPGDYMPLLEGHSCIRRITAAPELKGALRLGKELRRRGILASMGHSDAVYDEIMAALENGYSHVTHLYSGMPQGVRRVNAYRVAGIVETALLCDGLTVEIIADGCHLPAPLLKLIYKIKGADKVALVTDAMRAAGMPEGEYVLGGMKDGQRVVVEDGVAKLLNRTSFAGSVATMDRLVRTMIRLADVPMPDAVKMAALTPARILGIDRVKGSIAPGKDADLVVFDDNIDVKLTVVGGTITYKA